MKPMATRNSERNGWNTWVTNDRKEFACMVGSLVILAGICCVVFERLI